MLLLLRTYYNIICRLWDPKQLHVMWVSRGCEIVNILEHKKRLQTKVENPVSNHSSNRKPRTQLTSRRETARAPISYQPPLSPGHLTPQLLLQQILRSGPARLDPFIRLSACGSIGEGVTVQTAVLCYNPGADTYGPTDLHSMNYKFKHAINNTFSPFWGHICDAYACTNAHTQTNLWLQILYH